MATAATRPSRGAPGQEALELLAAVDLDAVRFEHALQVAADALAEAAFEVTCSCITIVQRLPSHASEAATSQPM